MDRYCLVLWLDAHMALERISRADAQKIVPVLTHTVGHLIAQNEQGVTLAVDSYPSEEGIFANYHHIPRAMIVSTIELVEREPEE
jgi:hypothetical protein